VTQAAVTQTAAVTTEISNSTDGSNNMTTHSSKNATNSINESNSRQLAQDTRRERLSALLHICISGSQRRTKQ